MSIRRSVAIFFSAKYIELLLGLVSSLILARLLSPEEFGKFLQSEIARWKGVVAKYKLELDL